MLTSFIKALVVPIIVIVILMGCITVTFTAASQVNKAVSELSGAIEVCAAEIHVDR